MTRLAFLKAKVKLVHRWIGIVALVLFALAALTGIAIQWDSELTKLGTERQVWRAEQSCVRCPLGKAAERLTDHIGDDRFTIDVSVPEFDRTAIDASATRQDASGGEIVRRFALDPASLAVREITAPPGFADRLMTWIYEVHYSLLLGLFGTVVMWIAALLLVIMPLTGLLLWWPMTRSKRGAFVTTEKLRGRAWYYDRHRIIGFYMVCPVLVIAATGFLMSLLDLFPRSLPTPTKPDGRAAAVAGEMLHPGVTPSAAQHYAQRLFPELRPVKLRFDTSQQRIEISMAGRDGLRPTRVVVDTQAGRPVAVDPPEPGAMEWLIAMARVLHNGEIVGIGGRILNMVIAGAIVFLAWSGLAQWRARRRAKRKSTVRSRV